MNCPICGGCGGCIKSMFCEVLDNSHLYKNIVIEKCSDCGHTFNKLSLDDINSLERYYEEEHHRSHICNWTSNTLYLGFSNLTSMIWEDNSFDHVVMDNVLEHSPNPIKVMMEVMRVLDNKNKRSYIEVMVPDTNQYYDNYFYILREHVQHFTVKTLKLLAWKSGFEVIELTTRIRRMVGELHYQEIYAKMKPSSITYCWGIGREFLYLYPNSRLSELDLVLVDDKRRGEMFKGMKIQGSEVLSESSEDSFLVITAKVHKSKLLKRAKEIGFRGNIIDVE